MRSNCTNTAFGIVTLKRSECSKITKIQYDALFLNNTSYCILVILEHSLIFRVTIPDAVLVQFDLMMMSTTLFETCRGL